MILFFFNLVAARRAAPRGHGSLDRRERSQNWLLSHARDASKFVAFSFREGQLTYSDLLGAHWLTSKLSSELSSGLRSNLISLS